MSLLHTRFPYTTGVVVVIILPPAGQAEAQAQRGQDGYGSWLALRSAKWNWKSPFLAPRQTGRSAPPPATSLRRLHLGL